MAAEVCVVTGAARGIGQAVVRRLVSEGYAVAALDREPVPELAGVRSWQVDVSDAADVTAAADEIERTLGGAGALVNVAGVLRTGPVAILDPGQVRAMLDVNVLGVLHCLQGFAAQLRKHRPARVVTVASNSAGTPRTGIGAYGATKAAASMLTRSFGLEEAANGIRCNVVNPGSTDTPMLRSMWADEEEGRARAVEGSPGDYRLGIPAGRVADPEDIADVVAFALSDRARHLWLQELYVDGGATLVG